MKNIKHPLILLIVLAILNYLLFSGCNTTFNMSMWGEASKVIYTLANAIIIVVVTICYYTKGFK